jgi:serine phosphatase RsbU (regulator of sigma subunit)
MHAGDQVLLYTDGIWDALADDDGRAEDRITTAIDRAAADGASLVDAILADVHRALVGLPQPDDLTLITARVLASA